MVVLANPHQQRAAEARAHGDLLVQICADHPVTCLHALRDLARAQGWHRLYWHTDRGILRSLVQRAEAAGYEALVLTVDAPASRPFLPRSRKPPFNSEMSGEEPV